MLELIEEVEQEIEEEIDEAFQNDSMRATTQLDDVTTQPYDPYDVTDDTTQSYWSDSNTNQFDWIDEMKEATTSGETNSEEGVAPSDGESANPPFGNDGMWGRNNVRDIDYSENDAAPFIVLGVIASVVFILMILIFVAKKLSIESERLKYRPLNESFSSSAQYHDNAGTNYQDLE